MSTIVPIEMNKRNKATGEWLVWHFDQLFACVVASPYATCLISTNTVTRLAHGPWTMDGRVVIDYGYGAVRYEFLGRWHNIIAFYDLQDRLTGYYCDIQRPLHWDEQKGAWQAEDLYLDIWVWPDGRHEVLDRDELAKAVARGWLSPEDAEKAKAELVELIRIVETGEFPELLF